MRSIFLFLFDLKTKIHQTRVVSTQDSVEGSNQNSCKAKPNTKLKNIYLKTDYFGHESINEIGHPVVAFSSFTFVSIMEHADYMRDPFQ